MIRVIIGHFIAFPPTQLVRVLCYTLSSLLSSIVLLYLGILPPFMSRMSWEFHHLLRILGMLMLLTITILSWVLVLIPTRVPTSERYCVDFVLLTTLLL